MKKEPKQKKQLALGTETVRALQDSDLVRVVGGKTTAITCTCTGTRLCGNTTDC